MSAEAVNALNQRADELDTEAGQAEANGMPAQSPQVATQHRHPGFLRTLANEFRTLAERMQGHNPETPESYGDAPDSAAAEPGLSVEKTDGPAA